MEHQTEQQVIWAGELLTGGRKAEPVKARIVQMNGAWLDEINEVGANMKLQTWDAKDGEWRKRSPFEFSAVSLAMALAFANKPMAPRLLPEPTYPHNWNGPGPHYQVVRWDDNGCRGPVGGRPSPKLVAECRMDPQRPFYAEYIEPNNVWIYVDECCAEAMRADGRMVERVQVTTMASRGPSMDMFTPPGKTRT